MTTKPTSVLVQDQPHLQGNEGVKSPFSERLEIHRQIVIRKSEELEDDGE